MVLGSPTVVCAVLAWLSLRLAGLSLASCLLSPVGFYSFDITHQVLSKADTKNLKRRTQSSLSPQVLTDNKAGMQKAQQTGCIAGICLTFPALTTRCQSWHKIIHVSFRYTADFKVTNILQEQLFAKTYL